MTYEPKAPGKPWKLIGSVPLMNGKLGKAWMHYDTMVFVISAVEMVEVEGTKTQIVAPHWHVSAQQRRGPERGICTDQDMELVRAAFDMGGAKEDNHGEGKARHLRMLCGRTREPECKCVQDEPQAHVGDRKYTVEEPRNG